MSSNSICGRLKGHYEDIKSEEGKIESVEDHRTLQCGKFEGGGQKYSRKKSLG